MNEEDRKKLNAVLNTQVKDNRSLKTVVICMTTFLTILVTVLGVVIGIMFGITKDTIATIAEKLDEGVTISIEEVDGEVGSWNVTKEGDIYK